MDVIIKDATNRVVIMLNTSISNTKIVPRTIEGAGATAIFTDQMGKRQRLVFAMRNPDYLKNQDKLDECEYPGGKVDPEDYDNSQSANEAASRAVTREWDEEVFSHLSPEDRTEGKRLFQRFLNMARFVDVQGAKATIRLFALQINLDCAVNDGGDRFLGLLVKADQALEESYKKDKSIVPLRGVVFVDLRDLFNSINNISNDISDIEKSLTGGKLMKEVGVYCAKYKCRFSHLHERDENQTIVRAIRKFNFFTLRELMK
jgi:hypothetical protein